MGELGILRRPPRGWLEAGAVALRSRDVDHGTGPEGSHDDIGTSLWLDVTWEVRVPSRAAYLVEERRQAPTWTSETFVGGSGRRWYSMRLRKSWGLLHDVEIPVRVDPDDARRLWVDWDGAYAVHEVAWRRKSAVERAVSERGNLYDRVAQRIADPFAGAVAPQDEHLVDERVARDRAELERQEAASRATAEAAPGYAESAAEQQTWQAMGEEMQRLESVGRRVEGRIVRVVDTERTLVGMPVLRLEIDVADPAPRTVAIEVPLSRRTAKRYQPGAEVVLKVDPADPANATISAS